MTLGSTGMRDWLAQRVSAVYLLGYGVTLGVMISMLPDASFESWQGLFRPVEMRAATALAWFFVMIHAWLGVWIVLTDYVQKRCWQLVFKVGYAGLLMWALLSVWIGLGSLA